ncbi:MAG TPA: endonuclease/exonuclease/phosphatase family protein [Actinomycetota bacterium]
MQLRVLVYNVRGFRDGLDRVLGVVEPEEPDVVLLSETGARRTLGRFAEALGMAAAGDPLSPFRRRVKNAVLIRPPWRVISHRLHRFPRSERFYPRGALIAQLGRTGERIWATSVHLGLHPRERRRHAEELADVVRGLPGPVVIGGDLNETPEGRAVRHLAARFWDVWATASGPEGEAAGHTFPAADPSARIDYLFVSDGFQVERAFVPHAAPVRAASDHRPLVAELRLGVGEPPSLSGRNAWPL